MSDDDENTEAEKGAIKRVVEMKAKKEEKKEKK